MCGRTWIYSYQYRSTPSASSYFLQYRNDEGTFRHLQSTDYWYRGTNRNLSGPDALPKWDCHPENCRWTGYREKQSSWLICLVTSNQRSWVNWACLRCSVSIIYGVLHFYQAVFFKLIFISLYWFCFTIINFIRWSFSSSILLNLSQFFNMSIMNNKLTFIKLPSSLLEQLFPVYTKIFRDCFSPKISFLRY